MAPRIPRQVIQQNFVVEQEKCQVVWRRCVIGAFLKSPAMVSHSVEQRVRFWRIGDLGSCDLSQPTVAMFRAVTNQDCCQVSQEQVREGAACFVLVLFALLVLPLSMAFTEPSVVPELCIVKPGILECICLNPVLFSPLLGMKFLEDCPIQPLIPLYLLVGGIVGALKVSLLLYDSTRMRQLLSKADDEYPWRQNAHRYYVHLILSLFLFLWFLLGNYWVFSVYLPDFIPPFQRPQNYCDKTLYLFAVGVLVLGHTVLASLLLCSACVYVWSRWRLAIDED
ncbi:Transmembrane protein 272 [Galemys pyrenaicus]|uniref:Transmembrane protein 272 n=1 Tax=Galemys pyrenaicus TaxID=202257 RepID=A0A8J6ANU1_GALPY|nr:Transmembrane protein 272 [Galemys pyrenaicus]